MRHVEGIPEIKGGSRDFFALTLYSKSPACLKLSDQQIVFTYFFFLLWLDLWDQTALLSWTNTNQSSPFWSKQETIIRQPHNNNNKKKTKKANIREN